MAVGGSFVTHNKVLPGAYINFISKARSLANIADRGTLAMAFKNDWGVEDKIITLDSGDFEKNSVKIFGYSYQDDKLMPIREAFKNAKEIKIFRLGGGDRASLTLGGITIKAKFGGKRGNSIKVKIASNVDEDGYFVYTYLDDILVDEKVITEESFPFSNDFADFSLDGAIEISSGANLSGGTDSNITNLKYSKFLEKIEAEKFDVLLYEGEDIKTKALFESFVKRLRDDEGVKICCVLYDYTKADFEGIVSVKNDKNLVYWTAGALAGANINESLTNKKYDGEYKFECKFSNRELVEAVEKGEFIFYYDDECIRVLKDINTFTNFSPDKNSDFSNNQIVRVLDSVGNDIARIFNKYYLGKVQNDNIGRDMFKSELISYFNELQSIRAIDEFKTEDVAIQKGKEKGDVVVDVIIKPVASMDKLYMKCIIE